MAFPDIRSSAALLRCKYEYVNTLLWEWIKRMQLYCS